MFQFFPCPNLEFKHFSMGPNSFLWKMGYIETKIMAICFKTLLEDSAGKCLYIHINKYVCICTHTHKTHTHISVYIYIHLHRCTSTCVCACLCTGVCVCSRTHEFAPLSPMQSSTVGFILFFPFSIILTSFSQSSKPDWHHPQLICLILGHKKKKKNGSTKRKVY